MKYGYYPGCSLEGISSEYDESIRTLFDFLNVSYEDLQDWICCGTLAAPSISHLLGIATPLWNIARSTKSGYEQIIAPCSECLYHFKHATREVMDDPELRIKVEEVLEMPLTSLPPTIHPLELLSAGGFEEGIRRSVKRDLSGLKAVCYYGCHISRPNSVMQFDDPENPQSMDRLLGWVGMQTLDWPGKVDCCGAHFSLIKPGIVVDLCQRLYETALKAGADVIVVGCPMCHANLDTRQEAIASKMGHRLNMPVLYFSQLLGYAFGLAPEKLGFKRHIVDPLPLMLEKCHAIA